MMKYFRLLLIPFCCISINEIFPQESYQVIPNKQEIEILTPSFKTQTTEKLLLGNGLGVYLISDPTLHQSGAAIAVNKGSWDDPKDQQGIAHFLEHMLFLGTEKYPEEDSYSRFISEHGGQTNAFTSNDRTSYIFTVNNPAFPEALDRFSSFFTVPLFNPSGVARELNAIDQEYAKSLDSDNFRELYVHKALGNPAHPNKGFNVGNSETLGQISREELIKWFKQNYSANLMKVVVYSALPLDQLRNLVVKTFGQIPNRERVTKQFKQKVFDKEYQGHLVYIEPIKDQRTLTILWELPQKFASMKDRQPESVICHLLGHEGKNSLFYYLKEAHLAEHLKCGGQQLGPNAFFFGIEIGLTKKGLNELNEVIKTVFQAINFYRDHGIPHYIFDEVHQLALLKYQFQEKDDEFRALTLHAYNVIDEDLSTYPEWTHVIQYYDPNAISEILFSLTPKKAHYDLLAPQDQLDGIEFDQKEPWFGVNYSTHPIPEEELIAFETAEPNPEVHYVEPNPFIPTDLSITHEPRDEQPLVPKTSVIQDNEWGKVYFAEDHMYGAPEVYSTFTIKTPEVMRSDPARVVLADIFIERLKEQLNPTTYLSTLADLKFSVSQEENGIQITLSGYRDKSEILLKKILKGVETLSINTSQFQSIKDRLLRKYQNAQKESSFEVAVEQFRSILYKNFSTSQEKEKALKKISLKAFNEFQERLFQSTFIEGVVFGNLTKDQGEKLAKVMSDSFANSPYPKEKHLKKEILVLPNSKGPFYVETEGNSQGNAILLGIEEPNFSFETRAAQQILMQAIKQPFFDTLRTKQQTGYLVFSQGEEVGRKLFNLFGVQSNSHNNRDLLSRIELFIESFLQELPLSEVPQEQYEKLHRGAIYTLKERPKNIQAMGQRLKTLVFDYDANFDWYDERLKALENLTYPQFLKISETLLGKRNKRRFALLIDGKTTQKEILKYEPVKTLKGLKNIASYSGD